MITKASQLGYQVIAVPVPPNFSPPKIHKLKDICHQNSIDFSSRVNLRPHTSRELIKNLRKLRRKFEIVAVLCKNKQVARQAAKDRRVDLVNFPSHNPQRRFFDPAEAELASHALTCLEIDIRPLITLQGRARIRLLSALRKEASIAETFNIPVILSTAASNRLLMRRPRETAALASLFDMAKPMSHRAVSKNPMAIIQRNREKLTSKFVAPGIRLIRRGKDCPKR